MLNLPEVIEKHNADFLQFENVANPLNPRRDLCAFLMLAELVPAGVGPLVSALSHNEIFLSVDCMELAEVVTEEQVRDLVRCGVRYSAEFDCLCMFV